MNNLEQVTFISPRERSELNGDLGLSTHEIAKSLGTDAKTIRKKLIAQNFISRTERLGYRVVPFGSINNSNKIGYTDYILDLKASKFLAAKWNSQLGDDYLNYLLTLEEKLLSSMKKKNSRNELQEIINLIQSDYSDRRIYLQDLNALIKLYSAIYLSRKQLDSILASDRVDYLKNVTSENMTDIKVIESRKVPSESPVTRRLISKKYFRGIHVNVVGMFLNKLGHPKTSPKRGRFLDKDLDTAATLFFADCKLVSIDEEYRTYFNPYVGNFRVKPNMDLLNTKSVFAETFG